MFYKFGGENNQQAKTETILSECTDSNIRFNYAMKDVIKHVQHQTYFVHKCYH